MPHARELVVNIHYEVDVSEGIAATARELGDAPGTPFSGR
jgi:hypothetical protein